MTSLVTQETKIYSALLDETDQKKSRAECHQKPDSSLIAEEAEKFQDVVLGERGVGKTCL